MFLGTIVKIAYVFISYKRVALDCYYAYQKQVLTMADVTGARSGVFFEN